MLTAHEKLSSEGNQPGMCYGRQGTLEQPQLRLSPLLMELLRCTEPHEMAHSAGMVARQRLADARLSMKSNGALNNVDRLKVKESMEGAPWPGSCQGCQVVQSCCS